VKPSIMLRVAGEPRLVPTVQAEELVRLAVLMAIEAPERQGAHSVSAGVSWESVHEVRAALDGLGIDWRALVRRRKQIALEQSARRVAARQAAAGQAP
jgi:hypothetical protein